LIIFWVLAQLRQLKLLMKRDKSIVEEATVLIADKVHYAEIIIDNSGTWKPRSTPW